MTNLLTPKPTNCEVNIKPDRLILTKTDLNGKIVDVNECFILMSGYSYDELVGASHNIVRHPDMPQTIFKLMWNKIIQGKNVRTIVKNLAKNGDYFWLLTEVEVKKDADGDTRNYIAYREHVSKKSIKILSVLYQKLKDIECVHGIDAGVEYMNAYLEEKQMSYDELVTDIMKERDGIFLGIKNIIFK